MTVESGLDRVAAGAPEVLGHLRGKRVGLLAHPASVTRGWRTHTRSWSARAHAW